MDFPVVKNLPTDTGDTGSIPGSGTSPGEQNGSPLQYSCQDNPHRRTWRAAIHWGRKKSKETERHSTAQHISMNCRSVFLPSLEKSDFFFLVSTTPEVQSKKKKLLCTKFMLDVGVQCTLIWF